MEWPQPRSCPRFVLLSRGAGPPGKAAPILAALTGDGVLDYRDRAILKTYFYTGVRLATACRLRMRDFHQDGDEATLTIKSPSTSICH